MFSVTGLGDWHGVVEISGTPSQWNAKENSWVKVLTHIWNEGPQAVLCIPSAKLEIVEDLNTAPEMANFKYSFKGYWEAVWRREVREADQKKAKEALEQKRLERVVEKPVESVKSRSGTIRDIPTTFELETEKQALEHEQFAKGHRSYLK